MKDILKYVPGFRSDKLWKKILSSIFYVLFFISIIGDGLEALFLMGGTSLFAFSIYELISNKKNSKAIKVPLIMLAISVMLIGAGDNITTENKAIAGDNQKIESLTKENEELKALSKELQLQNESFEDIKKFLESENKRLKGDNEKLKGKVKDFQKEVEKLKTLNEDLEAKKEQEKKVTLNNKSTKKTNNSNATSSGSKSSTARSPKPANIATVLVTPTGKRYHRIACGNGSYYSDTLANAKARGLTPCSKCY